jgi:hypothetical protein
VSYADFAESSFTFAIGDRGIQQVQSRGLGMRQNRSRFIEANLTTEICDSIGLANLHRTQGQALIHRA